jgi:hypothetical protein
MAEANDTVTSAGVRDPLLRGHQPVAGLWFPNDWLDEAQRSQRVLAHWQPGSTVWRFAQGDLLRFAAVRELQCESLGGWPLRLQRQTLCSAPLTQQEVAVLPAADVWLVVGAQVCALHVRDAQPMDPAQWLAIDNLALHDTYDCSATLQDAIDLLPPATRDVREVLNGRVGAPTEAQRKFLAAMANRQTGNAMNSTRPPGLAASPRSVFRWPPWVAIVLVVLLVVVLSDSSSLVSIGLLKLIGFVLLVLFLRRVLRSGTSWDSTPASPATTSSVARSGKPPFTLPERAKGSFMPQAWRQWLARLAITTQLSQLLGRRQAAYMRKMLDLFESGQLDEALRHAIPLGADGQSLGQAFGTPSARSDLSLNRSNEAATSINFGPDLDAHLRQLYRQTFEKLDRAGRVDEAVFVLAELLKSRQEALDYLEKHERYQQAAELALAWDCAADVIVRMHCLAGDWRMALAVARRDKAFSNAVLQLEKRWPDAAARLRQEWAQTLVTGGDWLGAVDAIWPLATERASAARWLLTAESAQGQLGARALVKRAVLLPDTWGDCAQSLQSLRDDPAFQDERHAVVQALLALKEKSVQAQQLARIVLPAVLADQAGIHGRLNKTDLQRLVVLAADPWLRADLPNSALPAVTPQRLELTQTSILGQCPEPGSLAILDAVPLNDGRYLVALGEAGAAIVDRHGCIATRFAVPAERIAIAHNRQMALVLAQRDRVSRVSRLDLVKREVQDLGMAELAHVATEFDGIAWTVASSTRLRVLDTQNGLQEVLWQVADLPGKVRGLSVNSNVEQVVMEDQQGKLELWRYALPLRRLLARGEALPDSLPNTVLRLLNPNGGVIDITMAPDDHGRACMAYRLHTRIFALEPFADYADLTGNVDAVVDGSWLLVCVSGHTRSKVYVISINDGRIRSQLDLPAQAMPQIRLSAGHCLVFDSQGRLWSMDTASSVARSLSLK